MVRISILVVFVCAFFSCQNKTAHKNPSQAFLEQRDADYMFLQRAYPFAEIKSDAYSQAIQWKKQQPQNRSQAAIWEFTGPLNVGGRITDIEIPNSQPQTYYIGAASGGIFKTINSGADWNPVFDDQQMLAIGDIETSDTDNNLVWAGTGEPNGGGGSLVYDGNGIYKSNDGGINWENKGEPNVGSISKIVIDPNDNNTVFFGAMGHLFKNDSDRGVYKTNDGGDNWEKVLFVSDSTGIADMAIHPTNGNIIYATSWERVRRPSYNHYGGATSNIYRSIDGGASWTILTTGLPSAPSQKGRINIDISKSNPNVLYAQYCNASGALQGVYKTSDGGDSWSAVNSAPLNNVGFNYWFGGIFIDPTDENSIYYVGFTVQKSVNGGTTWSDTFPNVHVDQHAFDFNFSNPGEILLGNDGGLYKSTNNGVSSVKDLKLPITQFYRFNVDPQNANKVYGGAQDNSTVRTQTAGLNDWETIFGGDGFQPLVDPTNTNVIYALSQYGNLGKSMNNGVSFNGATNGISGGDPKNWDTPITFDPSNSQILYYGANKVYKSTNAATNWTAISPNLSNGPYSGNLTFGTITTLDVSPLNSNIIYAGTDDGNVWVTTDGGNNWNLISSTLPNRWTTKVLASRVEASTVYVTFSGYRYGEYDGHVFKSIDLGQNWIDISSNLPDIPVNDIVQDALGILFLGTDIGVLASNNEGASWQVVGENIPSVIVTDLFIHETTNYLYAATYGRSSYKLDLSSVILNTEEGEAEMNVSVYPNPAQDFVNFRFNNTSVERKIIIYDALGRRVQEANISFGINLYRISVQDFQKGIYFIKISEGRKIYTHKIIVQ